MVDVYVWSMTTWGTRVEKARKVFGYKTLHYVPCVVECIECIRISLATTGLSSTARAIDMLPFLFPSFR